MIAFLDGILVLLFAIFVFGVPFVGSYLLLLMFGFIYVATAACTGLVGGIGSRRSPFPPARVAQPSLAVPLGAGRHARARGSVS